MSLVTLFSLSRYGSHSKSASIDGLVTDEIGQLTGWMIVRMREGLTEQYSTGTHISIIPAVTLAGYSASKAALNVFTLCLREQLKAAESTVRVIEIYPPVVQSQFPSYSRLFSVPFYYSLY